MTHDDKTKLYFLLLGMGKNNCLEPCTTTYVKSSLRLELIFNVLILDFSVQTLSTFHSTLDLHENGLFLSHVIKSLNDSSELIITFKKR